MPLETLERHDDFLQTADPQILQEWPRSILL